MRQEAPMSTRSFSQLLDELQQTRDSIARSMAGALEEATQEADGKEVCGAHMLTASMRGLSQRGSYPLYETSDVVGCSRTRRLTHRCGRGHNVLTRQFILCGGSRG